MKVNKLYLIKTLSVKDGKKELSKETQEIILERITKVLDANDDKDILIEEFENKEFMFFRLSHMKIMRICSIIDPYINYKLEEVSKKVILGNINEYDFVIKNSEFKNFFESFRLDNTSIDDVLDKITVKGINSLDEIDKIILTK
jgi:hypothetical protein